MCQRRPVPSRTFRVAARCTRTASTSIPTNPVKALPATPPGSGSKVDIFTTAFLPLPPTPLEQNPAWQEVNKQLNATVNFNVVSMADFQAKFAALTGR